MYFKEYKLSEIGEVVTGKTPKKNNPEFYNSKDIMFIKPDDLSQDNINMINKTKEYVSIKGAETVRILPINSVLVTCIGIIGKVGVLSEDKAVFNQQINAIIPNENIIIPKYLAYCIWYNKYKLQAMANAPVVPIINKTKFSEFTIPVPNLKIQEKIVQVLDKAKILMEKRKSQIDTLDKLTQSVFLEMFGDPVTNNKKLDLKKLSETGELKRGMSKHRPRNAPELLGGPYPLIQTGDVANSNIYIREYHQTYSELGLKQSRMWPTGTLCITIAANIARTGILTFDACFPDSVVAYLPNKNMSNLYVHFWFKFLQRIIEEKAPESAQKNINLKILSNLDIPVPPIEKQKEFEKLIGEIEKRKEIFNKSLLEIQNNYNSLMQRAFKGELFPDKEVSNL